MLEIGVPESLKRHLSFNGGKLTHPIFSWWRNLISRRVFTILKNQSNARLNHSTSIVHL